MTNPKNPGISLRANLFAIGLVMMIMITLCEAERWLIPRLGQSEDPSRPRPPINQENKCPSCRVCERCRPLNCDQRCKNLYSWEDACICGLEARIPVLPTLLSDIQGAKDDTDYDDDKFADRPNFLPDGTFCPPCPLCPECNTKCPTPICTYPDYRLPECKDCLS